jgi:malonyl-CoA/methylmalonyl-CoA synthetase
MNENLFARFADTIADPSKIVIESADSERYSYANLVSLTGRLANALTSLGVKTGDRVAVQVEKSVPALALYLATLRAGAIFLPLNTAYTPAEIEYFVGDAEPSLFVGDPARLPAIEPIATRLHTGTATLDAHGRGSLIDLADRLDDGFATVVRSSDDLAAILYTSGTTGRSKGAMLTHDNLVSNALTLREYWRFTDRDVLIHALPIYHTHGLFVATNCVLFSNASMIFQPKFGAETVLAALPRATALMGVPTFYTRLLQDPRLTRRSLPRRTANFRRARAMPFSSATA